MRFMHRIVVVALLFWIDEGKVEAPKGLQRRFTKEFDELMSSMQSTESGAKMYRNVLAKPDFLLYGYDLGKCSQRLRHIISGKMNCRGVAAKLESQLLSVQIYSAMMKDEQLWESILTSRNCSQLSGESLELCEVALSGRIHAFSNFIETNLNQEIDSCYIEERGNSSNYLTKR